MTTVFNSANAKMLHTELSTIN